MMIGKRRHIESGHTKKFFGRGKDCFDLSAKYSGAC